MLWLTEEQYKKGYSTFDQRLGVIVHGNQYELLEVKHTCPYCRSKVDPETCHCGTATEDHTFADGHSPVPMGCTCHLDSGDRPAITAYGGIIYIVLDPADGQ